MTEQPILLAFPPGAMTIEQVAYYTTLSPSLVKKAAQSDPDFPKPVQLTKRRVAWRRSDIDAWLLTREASSILPPEGSGYGRAGKPEAVSS